MSTCISGQISNICNLTRHTVTLTLLPSFFQFQKKKTQLFICPNDSSTAAVRRVRAFPSGGTGSREKPTPIARLLARPTYDDTAAPPSAFSRRRRPFRAICSPPPLLLKTLGECFTRKYAVTSPATVHVCTTPPARKNNQIPLGNVVVKVKKLSDEISKRKKNPNESNDIYARVVGGPD